MWDTTQYLRYGGERSRPFFDLLARVGAEEPGYVVDMGCGPGNLTVTLAGRWPSATVVGVDSSPEMIEAAQARLNPGSAGRIVTNHAPGLSFMRDDVRHWKPQALPDLIVSNAVLQWVPEHRELLVDWAGWLANGGWLAFQVPGNFAQPSHAIMREMAESPRWRPLMRDADLNRQSADPADYAELLAQAGCEVDAWETTYVHILHGENRCSSGTRARGCGRCWLCWTPNRRRTSSPSMARNSARRIRHVRSARSSPSAVCSRSPAAAASRARIEPPRRSGTALVG
jgi:trans-aconitate 2-methyltransferase